MKTFKEFMMIAEGMDMKAFKENRKKAKASAARADAVKRGHVGKEWYNSGRRYSPDEARRGRANMDDEERSTRHRSAVDPEGDDSNYSADKTKNLKKLRKQKAMGELGESAVPGKPAERLGAVTAIPKSEQEAARERILAKTKAKREEMKNIDETIRNPESRKKLRSIMDKEVRKGDKSKGENPRSKYSTEKGNQAFHLLVGRDETGSKGNPVRKRGGTNAPADERVGKGPNRAGNAAHWAANAGPTRDRGAGNKAARRAGKSVPNTRGED